MSIYTRRCDNFHSNLKNMNAQELWDYVNTNISEVANGKLMFKGNEGNYVLDALERYLDNQFMEVNGMMKRCKDERRRAQATSMQRECYKIIQNMSLRCEIINGGEWIQDLLHLVSCEDYHFPNDSRSISPLRFCGWRCKDKRSIHGKVGLGECVIINRSDGSCSIIVPIPSLGLPLSICVITVNRRPRHWQM